MLERNARLLPVCQVDWSTTKRHQESGIRLPGLSFTGPVSVDVNLHCSSSSWSWVCFRILLHLLQVARIQRNFRRFRFNHPKSLHQLLNVDSLDQKKLLLGASHLDTQEVPNIRDCVNPSCYSTPSSFRFHTCPACLRP